MFSLIFLFLLFPAILSQILNYDIYSKNNDYPCAYRKENGEIIVLGGTSPGSFHKFTKNGFLIEEKDSFISYESYPEIIQIPYESSQYLLGTNEGELFF